MSDYSESQNLVHSGKTNIVISAIIVILILIVSLQLWILYGALNAAGENQIFVWAAFGSSLLLFIAGLWLLKYLPELKTKEEKDTDNPYE